MIEKYLENIEHTPLQNTYGEVDTTSQTPKHSWMRQNKNKQESTKTQEH